VLNGAWRVTGRDGIGASHPIALRWMGDGSWCWVNVYGPGGPYDNRAGARRYIGAGATSLVLAVHLLIHEDGLAVVEGFANGGDADFEAGQRGEDRVMADVGDGCAHEFALANEH
jgi:hypothetical protein